MICSFTEDSFSMQRRFCPPFFKISDLFYISLLIARSMFTQLLSHIPRTLYRKGVPKQLFNRKRIIATDLKAEVTF